MTPMTKKLAAACALAAIAGTPGAALAWASGTHAYVAIHTAKKAGLTDESALCNRTYGAIAVDLFNEVFTREGQALAAVLHDPTRDVPVQPWHAARTDAERAFAYGFASHNDAWGTDSIAHYAGITSGKDDGYVVAKAKILREDLRKLVAGTLPLDEDQLLFVSHVLVEYAIDLLLAKADPSVAPALIQAAACPGAAGTGVLVEALVPEFSGIVGPETAEQMIAAADAQLRYALYVKGSVLSRDDALSLVAQGTAAQADAWLGYPPGTLDPVRQQLLAVVTYALVRGQELCAGDVLDELGATIGRVNGKMSSLGISP